MSDTDSNWDGSVEGDVHDMLRDWYVDTTPYFRHLLQKELGSAPHDDVVYHPRALYIFAVRHRMTLYAEFVRSMQRAKCILDSSDRGQGLLVRPRGQDIADATDQFSPLPVGDDVGGAGVPFTECATRLLPDDLKSLGGFVLRAQGGAEDEGFIVPPSIVHYSTFLAQVAEMQAEGGGGECAPPSEQWASEPADWEVPHTHVDDIRTALCAQSNGPLVVPVVEANTSSKEILGLVASYCTMVAAEHVHLDGEGLLDAVNLPNFSDVAAAGVVDGDRTLPDVVPKKLPVSLKFENPSPHLNATFLLPSCGDSNTQFAAEHLANNISCYAQDVSDLFGAAPFIKIPDEGTQIIDEDEREDRINLYDQLASAVSRLSVSIEGDAAHQLSLVAPVEALFALDVLLPSVSNQNEPSAIRGDGADPPSPGGATNENPLKTSTSSTPIVITTPLDSARYKYGVNASPDTMHNLLEDRTPLNSITFMFSFLENRKKQIVSDAGCLVEPRLGDVNYTLSDDALVCEYTNPSPYCLSCTVKDFLKNAEAKAEIVLRDVGSMGDNIDVTTSVENGMYHCHQLPTSNSISYFVFPSKARHQGQGEIELTLAALSSPKNQETRTDPTSLLASLHRTTEVMKVANFLGILTLVELCGLVIAILLQGRSLEEIRAMFKSYGSTATV